MSHSIHYNSIINEARFIEQLAAASREFISILRKAYPAIEEPLMLTQFSLEVEQYQDWLIDTVSSSLISSATRVRVLQDSYNLSTDDPSYRPDKEAFDKFPNIVQVKEGAFRNSIRECCNKIIHATSYELEFVLDSYGTEYWTGWCFLGGKFQKDEWCIKLNTISFSLALRSYISIIKYL